MFTCLGCGGEFAQTRSNATIPICYSCKRDPDRRNKAIWKHRLNKMQQRVDEEALRDTANLKRSDSFTPLQAEKLIEKMQRGEW